AAVEHEPTFPDLEEGEERAIGELLVELDVVEEAPAQDSADEKDHRQVGHPVGDSEPSHLAGAHEQAEDEADDDHEAVAVDRKAERGLDLAEHAFSERGRWAWDAIASKGRSPEPTRRDGIVTALRTNGRSR